MPHRPVKKRTRPYHERMSPFARELAGTPLTLVLEEDLEAAPPLAADEEKHLLTLAHPKRRREWLLGRAAAKAALARASGEPIEEIRVLPSEDGAPSASCRGEAVRCGLSISHGHGRAIAWAVAGGLPGVDLERVKPRPEGTFRFYLEPREREPLLALRGEERDRAAVVLWSLKEAAWKTLRPHRGIALLDFELAPLDALGERGETTATPRQGALELARRLNVSRIRVRFVLQGELVYSWASAE